MKNTIKTNPVVQLFKEEYNREFNKVIKNSPKKELYMAKDVDICNRFSDKSKMYLKALLGSILPLGNIKFKGVLSGHAIFWLMVYFSQDRIIKHRVKLWRTSVRIDGFEFIPVEEIFILRDKKYGSAPYHITEGYKGLLSKSGWYFDGAINDKIESILPFASLAYGGVIDKDLNIINKKEFFSYGIEKYQELEKRFGRYTIQGYPLTDKMLDSLSSLKENEVEHTTTTYSGGGKTNRCTIKYENINGVKIGYLLNLPYYRKLAVIEYEGKRIQMYTTDGDKTVGFKYSVFQEDNSVTDRVTTWLSKKFCKLDNKRAKRRSEWHEKIESEVREWLYEIFDKLGLSTINLENIEPTSQYDLDKEFTNQQKAGVINWYKNKVI